MKLQFREYYGIFKLLEHCFGFTKSNTNVPDRFAEKVAKDLLLGKYPFNINEELTEEEILWVVRFYKECRRRNRYDKFLDRRRREYEKVRNTTDIKSKLISRDGETCRFCKSTKELQIDHIRPLSRGGTDDIRNFQLLCKKCNPRKRNKIIGSIPRIPPAYKQESFDI